MNYRRDFTIGLREALGLYWLLALEKWRKGALGFGLAGALTVWLYTDGVAMPLRAALTVLAAPAVAGIFLLGLYVYTWRTVRGQLRRRGREAYVQETEIGGFGIRVTVGKERSKLGFERLERVRETRRAFYLFLSADQAWILPKAQMADPAGECRELRELFRKVMESRRLRIRK